MLLSVIKEKLMVNLSFPLTSRNIKRGLGGVGVAEGPFPIVTCKVSSLTTDQNW